MAYSENANNTGTVAITLMSTSASIAYLRDLCNKRQQIRLDLADANTDAAVHISEERCRVLKMPDIPRVKEQTSVTINIYVPDLNIRTAA